MFNILCKGSDGSGFVLFRALEPLAGLDLMRERRGVTAETALCSGPGKLTKALGIGGAVHGASFLGAAETGIVRGAAGMVLEGGRIGISRAADRPWRFGAAGSDSLSRRFDEARN